MSTAYQPATEAEQMPRIISVMLAPIAGLCWLVERTLPASERGGR